ncbi:Enoyl-[acyl-carrier-protein] reductase [Blattella germanica]|nr:Enoyl-[acyl-carrier-protein] reductase [Blattella germanica]
MSREPVIVPTSALIFKDVIIRGFWMTQWSIDNAGTEEHREMMDDIYNLYEEGLLKPPVHKSVPFDKYHEALENTMNPKGFAGVKYIIDFKNEIDS